MTKKVTTEAHVPEDSAAAKIGEIPSIFYSNIVVGMFRIGCTTDGWMDGWMDVCLLL
jgi:hypothetical protein